MESVLTLSGEGDVAHSPFQVFQESDSASEISVRDVAEEMPLALEINGISHSVMFISPIDIKDFVVGFCVTEGIICTPKEIYDIEVGSSAMGLTAHIRVSAERAFKLRTRKRTLAGRTGCGRCGLESLEDAVQSPDIIHNETLLIDHQLLHRGFFELSEQQRLMASTGATHAAAWMSVRGLLGPVREDVGRHNALDKVIGALLRQGNIDVSQGMVLVTSRASYEMVYKTAKAGIAALAAISAPTALAVRIARHADLTLLGFVRNGCLKCYSGEHRLRRI